MPLHQRLEREPTGPARTCEAGGGWGLDNQSFSEEWGLGSRARRTGEQVETRVCVCVCVCVCLCMCVGVYVCTCVLLVKREGEGRENRLEVGSSHTLLGKGKTVTLLSHLEQDQVGGSG